MSEGAGNGEQGAVRPPAATQANPWLNQDAPWPRFPLPVEDGAIYTGAQVKALLSEWFGVRAQRFEAWHAEAEVQWAKERELRIAEVLRARGETEGERTQGESDEFRADGGSDE